MQQYTTIDYRPDLDIRNADSLPRGVGTPYLLCLYVEAADSRGPDGETLIAKSWHRRFPKRRKGEAVVIFPGAGQPPRDCQDCGTPLTGTTTEFCPNPDCVHAAPDSDPRPPKRDSVHPMNRHHM